MNMVAAPTIMFQIFLAGQRLDIERECAKFCLEIGLCVSVEPTKFIYTGGVEDGALVRLLNYPRFPSTEGQLSEKAKQLAHRLIEACSQHSALVVGPIETIWITRRENNPI